MITLPMTGNWVLVAHNQSDWDYLMDVYAPNSRYIKNGSHTMKDMKNDFKQAGGSKSLAFNIKDGVYEEYADINFYLTEEPYKSYSVLDYTAEKARILIQETEYIEL